MMRAIAFGGVALAMLAACGPMNPERAAERCEERARAAQGPTGSVTIGVNSKTGGFSRASVGVSSDFLRGRDPDAVYDECVFSLTGEMPIRRPVLRN